ncbi:MAG: nucleotide sugar dehydrogenase [Verrucomicrobiota bacterium]|nr:nucleotide sugar dehydrogenase [Verrucomicrobiota bacterium]
MKIGIIGLGYVGLPLVIQFAKSGAQVLGIDVDKGKVEAFNRGESYIKHIPSSELALHIGVGNIEATTDFSRVNELEAILICVPTPLDDKREPDLTYVMNTGRSIAPHLTKGILVVLESTTYPGTTEDDLRVVLEKGSGLKAGSDFHLAYSPEREDPGNPDSKVAKIPKVVGGYTPACLDKAMAVYSSAIETIIPVSSCRVAEATKLLENIFRSVNIALVNELKLIYHEMGIDIWEVIEAAKTKPFGFTPFYPGPGLGGHCIPIDPFYLSWKAREYGLPTRFIELSGEINHAMPGHVVKRCIEGLNEAGKPVKGSRVLLFGLAYKPDVDDCRESPAFEVMEKLRNLGAEIDYYDPHVPEIPLTREHSKWAGLKSTQWDEEYLRACDAVVILTNHSGVDYAQLAEWAPLVVDTRNAMAGLDIRSGMIFKA